MGRFFNIKYFDVTPIIKHWTNNKVGNCVNCGEFLNVDDHHTLTQSRGGESEHIVHLCRKCHAEIEYDIEKAKKKNLYKSGYNGQRITRTTAIRSRVSTTE